MANTKNRIESKVSKIEGVESNWFEFSQFDSEFGRFTLLRQRLEGKQKFTSIVEEKFQNFSRGTTILIAFRSNRKKLSTQLWEDESH